MVLLRCKLTTLLKMVFKDKIVTIGILDTGIDSTHSELQGKVTDGGGTGLMAVAALLTITDMERI